MIEPSHEKSPLPNGDAHKVVAALDELLQVVQVSGSYVRHAPIMPNDATLNFGVRFTPVVRDSGNTFFFVIGHLCEATAEQSGLDIPDAVPETEIGQAGSKVLYRVEADFLLQYRVKADSLVTDDDLNAFAKANGVFNVQPFWREYLLSTSLRAQLPGVVAPIVKLQNGSMPPTRTRIVNG